MRAAPRSQLLARVALLALVAPQAAADAGPARDRLGGAPLAAGEGYVTASYELSLSTRVVGAPWGLALDGAVALTPRLTLAVSQSAAALGTIDRSGGLCLVSGAHACPRRWRGGTVDVRWRVHDGRLAIAALARLGLAGVDPARPLARLGLRGAAHDGRWWLVASPELTMSLGQRALGNRDTLEAPLWLGVDAGPISGWLRTGARGDLAGFGDKLEVAIAAGIAIGHGRWRAGVDAGWPQLLGPQNSFKQRQAALWLAVER